MEYVKCPACGAVMVFRTGSRGAFYGCSRYPACRMTVDIENAEGYMVREVDSFDDDVDIASKRISGPRSIRVSEESPLTKLPDSGLPTSSFPLLKFKFDEFNPSQVECMKYYDKDVNFVLALPTGAGKSPVAEMFMAYSLSCGKRVAYISPLKALTQEKYDDWTNAYHDWGKKKISILTGDYSLSKEKIKELNVAEIILMTSEMLCSRVRKVKSEKSGFLQELGTICVDEAHLLCTSRGPALECGLMKFTKINPDCRVVFLSATMPNVIDMCDWLTTLNGKKTEMVNSDQRPVPLEMHWIVYPDSGVSGATDKRLYHTAQIVESYPSDNFILFVHAKAVGRKLKSYLGDRGIDAEFHCADLKRDARARIEGDFRSKKLRVLISTSTLAFGINV